MLRLSIVVSFLLLAGVNAHAVHSGPTDNPGYWLADIPHQGIAAFNPNPSTYKVFRNVKEYGAKGTVFSWLSSKYL